MSIYYYDTVDSTFEAAFELVKADILNVWDSVQALMQTAGRGQMRSHWVSLPGNVFASIRLPYAQPFSGLAGAIAVGVLCVEALRDFGCQAGLKWPNDLVMRNEEKLFKVGGILLEERNEILISGVGVNLTQAPLPCELDRDDALLPGALEKLCAGASLPDAEEWWKRTADFMRLFCQYNNFEAIWNDMANGCMVWRNERVCVGDGGWQICGRLEGITKEGACVIATDEGRRLANHGTLRLCGE